MSACICPPIRASKYRGPGHLHECPLFSTGQEAAVGPVTPRSASERLRELEVWESGRLFLLVPLIADVVEAAENAVTCAWMDKATDEQNAELKRRADAVGSSVAALREALEEK